MNSEPFPQKLRVFLADDHAVVREGLRLLINAQPDMEVVGEAADGEAAWRETKALQPDVVVMDVSMPKLNGVQAAERLQVTCPHVKIVALSAYSDTAHIRRLLASGAKSYVLKHTAATELIRAIRAVAEGGVYLDPAIAGRVVESVNLAFTLKGEESLSGREQEILIDVARGYTNKEVAERLRISIKTVESHKARILEKLDIHSRAEIVSYALRHGWLQDGSS